jgi:hypothetical protein
VGAVILVAVSCVCVWLTVRPKPEPTQIVWSNSNLEWKVGDAKLCEFKPMLDGSGKVLVCDERDALFEWYEDVEQGISPSFLDSSSRHDVLVTFHGQKASGWKCRRLSDSFECSRANITVGKRPNGLTVIREGDEATVSGESRTDNEFVPTPAMRIDFVKNWRTSDATRKWADQGFSVARGGPQIELLIIYFADGDTNAAAQLMSLASSSSEFSKTVVKMGFTKILVVHTPDGTPSPTFNSNQVAYVGTVENDGVNWLQSPSEAASASSTDTATAETVKLAPAWNGEFTYLGMRTGMTKQEALRELGKFRDMNITCRVFSATGESCDGRENELALSIRFSHGRLTDISAEDKYSPFGVFAAPFLQRFGTPDIHTDSKIEWSAGDQITMKDGSLSRRETCTISLRKGKVDIDIVRWGKIEG